MPHATVCLTFDFDAVSIWVHRDPAENTPTNRSRGVFGAEVGTPRLLDLLDRCGVPATWFVPGHTIESFTDACEAIVDEAHEIAHHGWSHRPPSAYETRAAERRDLERGIAAVEGLTGERPDGYRSPSWDFSEHTVSLLRELGFEWDSSGMARDVEPYRLRDDAGGDPNAPYDSGEATDLVEVPVSWHRDDYPAFGFARGKGFVNEAAVFRAWRDGFDWMYDHGGGVYVLTMHPQVIGLGRRLDRLESLVDHVRGRPDVEFARVSTVARRFDRAR